MNILQTIYQFKTGSGALKVVGDLVSAARSSGHNVTILAQDEPVAASAGAKQFFTGNRVLDWWRLWQHLLQTKYDIVHVHDHYCALLMSLIPDAPPTVQTNHIAYRTHRRLTRFSNCVVGCSKGIDQHHAEFFQLPENRRAVIANGVFCRRPNLTIVQQLRERLPTQLRDRQICLTVGGLVPQKGHVYLLDAIALLPPSVRESWCFVFAGEGELEGELRYVAAMLGILRNVVFLGHTPDIPEWLALANAFVLPSLHEGLSLTLLEAMAAGLPCLATAVDGNQEVLHHGENGLLCSPANSQHLSQALTTLLTDTELRTRLSKQAQTDYERRWTFEHTWQQYELLYRRLCQMQPESVTPVHSAV